MSLRIFLLSAPFFICQSLYSQDTLSGVINQYAAVIAIDSCQARLTTGSSSATFSPGERVLLIQMAGATIDASNSSSFGDIIDPGGAGLFEQNEVLAVSGPDVFLKYELAHEYDAGGAVQLVSFPLFEDASVTAPITALPFQDGYGGIVAFEVENTLTLGDDILANGQGFASQDKVIVTSNCNFITNANNYYYDASDWRGAPKGQGIAQLLPGKQLGRGAQANGGGGGNDHNSGGGGGSQLTAGGMGGKQVPPSALGCHGNFPGRGGKPLPAFPERIYLGGSGGNGHVDDTGAGSTGGAGGGIVLILTDTLVANDHTIAANGQSPATAPGDGGGGGGGGGTLLVRANQLTGTLHLTVLGGDGSDVQNPTNRCFGPGGGGGGGRVLTNLTGLADIATAGGNAGKNLTPSPQCSTPTSEATNGGEGIVEPFPGVPFSSVEVVTPAIVSSPQPAMVCEGDSAFFEITTLGNGLGYQWQANDGSGWQDVQNGSNFSGALSPALSVVNVPATLSGLEFRCLVTGACTPALLSGTAVLSVETGPQAAFSISPTGGLTFSFENTSANATAYLWDFGDNTTSTSFSPEHSYNTAGNYTVTLTAYNDCDSQSLALTLSAGDAPMAAFSSNVQVGCVPLVVQFQNQSAGTDIISFDWQFPGGTPGLSSDENPTIIYTQPGLYDVSLAIANFLGADTTIFQNYIDARAAPVADFSFSAVGLSVVFTNNSTGGTAYFWEFGDGETSTEENPSHTYATEGAYPVTLTVSNADCGSAILLEVMVQTTKAGETDLLPGIRLFPNPVRSELTIVLPQRLAERASAALSTLDGAVVKKQILHSSTNRLSMDGLPAGLFLLEIRMGWQSAHFKVVKLP